MSISTSSRLLEWTRVVNDAGMESYHAENTEWVVSIKRLHDFWVLRWETQPNYEGKKQRIFTAHGRMVGPLQEMVAEMSSILDSNKSIWL